MELIQANSTNYQTGRNTAIKYIVIHYTGNKGDTARNNCKYFQTGGRGASAHFFVDANEIVQSVKDSDTAWSVGDGNGKYGITNSNSISVEMCDFMAYNEAVANRTFPLIRELMAKYGVPISNVVRHYDASRKLCPAPLVDSTEWANFKNKINGSEDNLMSKEYEELDKKIADLSAQLEQSKIKYAWIDSNLPSWATPTIQKLYDRKLITGNEKGELMLSDEMNRILVILDRAGVFGV